MSIPAPGQRPGRRPRLPLRAGAALGTLLLTVALAGCSGGESAGEEPDASASPSTEAASDPSDAPTQAPTTPVAETPEGVEVTEAGTELSFGDDAVVAVPLAEGVGALRIRVEEVREAPLRLFRGWLSGQSLEESRPYFVDVRLVNVGDVDLSRAAVPLFLRDDNDTVGPPWSFDGPEFRPCPSGPLPKKFDAKAKVSTCLVYLAPRRARFAAMSTTPTLDVEPVTWTGRARGLGEPADERGGEGRKKDGAGR